MSNTVAPTSLSELLEQQLELPIFTARRAPGLLWSSTREIAYIAFAHKGYGVLSRLICASRGERRTTDGDLVERYGCHTWRLLQTSATIAHVFLRFHVQYGSSRWLRQRSGGYTILPTVGLSGWKQHRAIAFRLCSILIGLLIVKTARRLLSRYINTAPQLCKESLARLKTIFAVAREKCRGWLTAAAESEEFRKVQLEKEVRDLEARREQLRVHVSVLEHKQQNHLEFYYEEGSRARVGRNLSSNVRNPVAAESSQNAVHRPRDNGQDNNARLPRARLHQLVLARRQAAWGRNPPVQPGRAAVQSTNIPAPSTTVRGAAAQQDSMARQSRAPAGVYPGLSEDGLARAGESGNPIVLPPHQQVQLHQSQHARRLARRQESIATRPVQTNSVGDISSPSSRQPEPSNPHQRPYQALQQDWNPEDSSDSDGTRSRASSVAGMVSEEDESTQADWAAAREFDAAQALMSQPDDTDRFDERR
ncbi:hypothetical protein CKM354_001042400 [Cercospora kikuchii]|uniref:Uncharacterized protein n=1 Tax=Cercospora kikuchii TaxID=84275 RepID=A0A9P3CQY9_9PEZI|nr:uncharacterized protein CKM354_001042400 [Cercospora kikuchii]GIZ47329.1 hypothetical protein CKM354_001042400 [Cercospora kikuchii]